MSKYDFWGLHVIYFPGSSDFPDIPQLIISSLSSVPRQYQPLTSQAQPVNPAKLNHPSQAQPHQPSQANQSSSTQPKHTDPAISL